VKPLAETFSAYTWAPSTAELARVAGLDPVEIVRFDGNVPPLPLASSRPGALAGAVARVNEYPHGGYTELVAAIARYNDVEPENIVLGAGADDLIMLCTRSFAGAGDLVAIADDPTYSLFRVAVEVAGATVGEDEPAFTLCCRPNNPTGALEPLPQARPLVVDEAYYEYCGETAVGLLDDGVVVLRTFSKAFALAGARIGYALAEPDTAAELNRRQAPAPISTLSAALAVAALARPPDVRPQVEERERLADGLRALGFAPPPSRANFVYVPTPDADALAGSLLRDGLVVRRVGGGFRVSVRDREDDDLLLESLARALERPHPPGDEASRGRRRARHLRATAETRLAVRLNLDGRGIVRVATGAGLYDHLLEQLAFHGGLDLVLEGAGDLETGDHHTAEDSALALGEALDRALGDRKGIARYGDGVVPMDDALAKAAVDLGGRPWAEIAIEPDPGMATHMLASLAQSGRLAIHVDASGRDAHHTAEAAFKAVGRALRAALAPGVEGVPSTKGKL
jgi:histidinol-phosphate/aromatic aminotransferase/cobyric acid decarboxylase-like protein/imidazoleglycerol phosphate dehydratase HisB